MNALLTIALLLTVEIGYLTKGHGGNFWRTRTQQRHRERPVNIMTDVINDLGVKVLDSYGDKNGNVAFSPTGLVFALAALYEGSAGRTSRQIAQVLSLPRDRRVTQIGLRDINRRVRSYINADAFLGSLSFNRDDIVLRPEYEETLRWYGFTIDNTIEVNETGNSTNERNETSTTQASDSGMPDSNATMDTVTTSGVNNSVGTTSSMMMVTVPTPLTVPGATESMDSITSSPAEFIANNDSSASSMSASLTNMDSGSPVNVDGTSNATISTTPLTPTTSEESTSDSFNDSTTIPPASATATTISSATLMASTASTALSANNSEIVAVNMSVTTAASTAEAATVGTNNSIINPTTTEVPVATAADFNDSAVTVAPLGADDNNVRKKRSSRNRRSGYSDEGIWIDEGGWQDYNPTLPDDDPGLINNDKTQLQFLVNGCEISTISTATYAAVLPFAYIPLLHSYGVEFPLDDPRYNVILLVPTEGINSRVLVKLLDGKQLRYIRRMMKATWIRATIPSFMLKGLISLTQHIQQLGINDAFEPRAADLSPMSLDLGVYARDVHQSIAVNIRNYMSNEKNDSVILSVKNHYRNPANYLHTREPVPFAVDRPFIFFIVDTETSCALIAGRIDDPLNSRIL